jgi:chaperonin cofactor prefoldin
MTTLTNTIAQFKKYIETVTGVVKELDTKVKETKSALKPAKKADKDAPPVKGKENC